MMSDFGVRRFCGIRRKLTNRRMQNASTAAKDRQQIVPRSDSDAERTGHPHAGTRRQAVHARASLDDCAGSEKRNARRHRFDDADRIELPPGFAAWIVS